MVGPSNPGLPGAIAEGRMGGSSMCVHGDIKYPIVPVEIKYKGKTHFTLNFLLYSLLTFTNVAYVCEMEKQQNNGRWGNFTVYVKHIYIYNI